MTLPTHADRPERRTKRSDNPVAALTCLLEHAQRKSTLEVLALADDLGCLVAGAGPRTRCEELAAFAPLVEKQRRSSRPRASNPRAFYRRLSVPGVEVYLCAEAKAGRSAEAGFVETQEGCERILRRSA